MIINVIGNSGENWGAAYFSGSTGRSALMSFTEALDHRGFYHSIKILGINPSPVATDRLLKIIKRKAIDTLGVETRW